MTDIPLLKGRSYLLKIGAKTVTATVVALRHKINVNTLEHVPTAKLELNEIGLCELELDRVIAFDAYQDNRDTGGFILIDRLTNNTIAAGLIRRGSRRAHAADWHAVEMTRTVRAASKGQSPCLILLPPDQQAVARLVERKLHSEGRHTICLEELHGLPVLPAVRLLLDAGLVVVSTDPKLKESALAPGELLMANVYADEHPHTSAERIAAEFHSRDFPDTTEDDYTI